MWTLNERKLLTLENASVVQWERLLIYPYTLVAPVHAKGIRSIAVGASKMTSSRPTDGFLALCAVISLNAAVASIYTFRASNIRGGSRPAYNDSSAIVFGDVNCTR